LGWVARDLDCQLDWAAVAGLFWAAETLHPNVRSTNSGKRRDLRSHCPNLTGKQGKLPSHPKFLAAIPGCDQTGVAALIRIPGI